LKGKFEGNKPFGRHWFRWEDNSDMGLKYGPIEWHIIVALI
jgi:hypothetical protein